MHGREKKAAPKKNTPSGVSSPTVKGSSPYQSYGVAMEEAACDNAQFNAMLDTLQSDKKAKSLEAIGTILAQLRALDNNTRSSFQEHAGSIMSAMESALNTNKKATLNDRVAIVKAGTLLAATHGDDVLELYDSWADVCFQLVGGSAASSNLRSAIGATCLDSLSILNACNAASTVQIGGSGSQGRGVGVPEGLLDLVMRRGYLSAISNMGGDAAVAPSLSTVPSSVIAASIPTLYTTFFGGATLGVSAKDVTNNTNNPDENDSGAATSGGIATGAAASSAAAAAAAALLLEGSPADLSFAAFLRCLALSCEASQSRKVRGVVEGAIGYFIGLNQVPVAYSADEFPTTPELLTTVTPATTALIAQALDAATVLNSRFPLLFASPAETSNPTSGSNSIPSTPIVGSDVVGSSILTPFTRFSLNEDGIRTLRKLVSTSGASMGKGGKRLLNKAIRSLEAALPNSTCEDEEGASDEDDTPAPDAWQEEGDASSEDEDDSDDDNEDAIADGYIIKIKFRKSKAVVITGYHRCVLTQIFRAFMEGGFHRHIVHNTALHRVLRPSQAGLVDDDNTLATSYKTRKNEMIQKQVATKRAADKERSRFRDQKHQPGEE